MDFISDNQWIIVLIPFSIIAVIGIVLGTKNLKREKRVRQEARRLGYLTGTQENIRNIEKAPAFFLLAPQGGHVRFLQIRNMIKGCLDDLEFIMFDYISTFSKGRTHTVTVLALPLPSETIPRFRLVPIDRISHIHKHIIEQKTADKLVKATSVPEFSKNYFLYSDDEHDVRRLFDDNTLRMLANPSSRGWQIVCANGWMNLCRNDKTVPPERLQDFLEESKRLYEAILDKRDLPSSRKT